MKRLSVRLVICDLGSSRTGAATFRKLDNTLIVKKFSKRVQEIFWVIRIAF